MSNPKTIGWGIIGPGMIARKFTKDLFVDPKTRGNHDFAHAVSAVASSSSIESAQKFIKEVVAPNQSTSASAYSSYESFVEDPQAQSIIRLARKKKLFFMEAVWTRFQPVSTRMRELVLSNTIGEVLRIYADLSVGAANLEQEFDVSHRAVNLDLAGGALLDVGFYSLTNIQDVFFSTISDVKKRTPKIMGAAMTFEPRTGADESTVVLLEYPTSVPGGKTKCHAIATTALRLDSELTANDKVNAMPAIRIQGEKGEIHIYGPISQPRRYRVVLRDGAVEDVTIEFDGGAYGMAYEADEAARCWMEGKQESERMRWDESVMVMKVMDEVRRICGLKYPERIESTDSPYRTFE